MRASAAKRSIAGREGIWRHRKNTASQLCGVVLESCELECSPSSLQNMRVAMTMFLLGNPSRTVMEGCKTVGSLLTSKVHGHVVNDLDKGLWTVVQISRVLEKLSLLQLWFIRPGFTVGRTHGYCH
jgi:hypothetical protein